MIGFKKKRNAAIEPLMLGGRTPGLSSYPRRLDRLDELTELFAFK
jgi:hypothetical protein